MIGPTLHNLAVLYLVGIPVGLGFGYLIRPVQMTKKDWGLHLLASIFGLTLGFMFVWALAWDGGKW